MPWVKRFVGFTLIAAAVAIALLALRSLTAERAQVNATMRAEAGRQAAQRQAELRAIESRAQAGAEMRALNAAVAAHVDSATINDLLDNEPWWRPFREEFPLVRLIVGDTVLAARGTTGAAAVAADVVARARLQMVASAHTSIGTAPYLVAAARMTEVANQDVVLVVGHPAPDPPEPPATARPPAAPAPILPWATAGVIAALGVGLFVSGARKRPGPSARARAVAAERAARGDGPPADDAAEAAVIPIVPESTLKFGEPRNDVLATATTVDRSAARPPTPAPTYVVVAPTVASPIVFGRYRLVERLSEGGMSQLFIAKAAGIEGFTRSFVLKRLRRELARDKDAVAQFIDEARLQADLIHSNIVPVFDFGVVAGEYFMTQEYIAGRDLDRLMERHAERGGRGLPAPIAYFAAYETLQALAYAHSRCSPDGTPLGIVHRDVSAGNIILSLAGEVKLSDFGIVKSNDRVNRTQTGMVKGNANYMSPEHARGQAVDARSDLYALGLVLYYCLSGELLYPGKNELEVLHHAAGGLLRDDFARIRKLPDPAPQILERALALDPNDRFQTATEFADELAVFMGGGRAGAAEMVRELFGQELLYETALPTAPAVGYTAGP